MEVTKVTAWESLDEKVGCRTISFLAQEVKEYIKCLPCGDESLHYQQVYLNLMDYLEKMENENGRISKTYGILEKE